MDFPQTSAGRAAAHNACKSTFPPLLLRLLYQDRSPIRTYPESTAVRGFSWEDWILEDEFARRCYQRGGVD